MSKSKAATMDEEAGVVYETPVQLPTGLANPAPLGLAAFGLTTFVLSMYNAGVGVGYGGATNVVVGLALFYGGFVQLLAGMWEFRTGNTFGATAFSSYGAFWLSYATLFVPAFGVAAAYKNPGVDGAINVHELNEALGIYLAAWAIFTGLMFLCTLRQNIASILLFGMLTLTFLLLSFGTFKASERKTSIVAGGYTGIVTAVIALYIVLANLANKEITYFTLPVGKIGPLMEKLHK